MTTDTTSMPNFLTVEQVAKRLNVSTDSIWRWKRAGHFPLAVRVGPGCTRWRLSDIEDYERHLQACFLTDFSDIISSAFMSQAKSPDSDLQTK